MGMEMDMARFEQFDRLCSEGLPGEVDQILKAAAGKPFLAIGFITTDDFYGCYLTWNDSRDIREYYEWENGQYPDFLYQPLVDVVDSCQEIDFCNPSEEKWEFAKAFLTVLEKNIKQLPEAVFRDNGCSREDILFFATMGDGDYIQELMDTSVQMFNSQKTLQAYGIRKGVD